MSPGLFVLAKADAARLIEEQIVGARLADRRLPAQPQARRIAVFAWVRRLRLGRARRALSERLNGRAIPTAARLPSRRGNQPRSIS